jgi:carbamoyltransferase
VLRDGKFDNIWIQPAAGDAGGALGAALAGYYLHAGKSRIRLPDGKDAMQGAYLGPAFDQEEIEHRLLKLGARFIVLDEPHLLAACVDTLIDGKALGWFQGRMEFGPRALGARSILGDARSPCMQSVLNLKIKYRESFRPFAPSVLREDVAHWFDMNCDSPYMSLVADVIADRRTTINDAERTLFGTEKLKVPRSEVPAVTHVDYSARIQTVHTDTNPRYHALLSAFKSKTGCPVIVNTSFNVRGEPIVCTPEEAFRCFMGTEIDGMAIGNCFLHKEQQVLSVERDFHRAFAPD